MNHLPSRLVGLVLGLFMVCPPGIARADLLEDIQVQDPEAVTETPNFDSDADDPLSEIQSLGAERPDSAQTVGDVYKHNLEKSGLNDKQIDQVMDGISASHGINMSGPMHDRVDFARFPNARIAVAPIDAPAALLITPELAAYVFSGSPDSFQGSFRTYEFHLGRGIQHAAGMIYRQVFPQLRVISDASQARPDEVVVVPELSAFKFHWGGTFTPLMYVSLSTSVQINRDGRSLFSAEFPVTDIKEDGESMFPTEDQEHRAISTALIASLKQSVNGINALRAQLTPPQPPPARAVVQTKPQPQAQVQAQTEVQASVGGTEIDMTAVMLLAGSWPDYHRNKHRLSKIERITAVRILRLQAAYDARDEDRQHKEIKALIEVAKDRNLDPSSRAELVEEIKRFQTDRQIQSAALNAEDDAIYNFAGEHTDTVLDYTGLGIDLAKTGVVVFGCATTGGTLCASLVALDASFGTAGTVAEGIGAGTAKLQAGGSKGEAAYEAAKAMVVDVAAGKVSKWAGEAMTEAVAHKSAQMLTKSHLNKIPEEMIPKVKDTLYVGIREDFAEVARFLPGVDGFRDVVAKQVTKDMAAYGESVLSGKKAASKAIKPVDGATQPFSAELNAL